MKKITPLTEMSEFFPTTKRGLLKCDLCREEKIDVQKINRNVVKEFPDLSRYAGKNVCLDCIF